MDNRSSDKVPHETTCQHGSDEYRRKRFALAKNIEWIFENNDDILTYSSIAEAIIDGQIPHVKYTG